MFCLHFLKASELDPIIIHRPEALTTIHNVRRPVISAGRPGPLPSPSTLTLCAMTL